MRRLLALMSCIAGLTSAPALANTALDQAMFLATCEGRSTAALYFEQFSRDGASAQARARHRHFAELLEAVTPKDDGSAALLRQQRRRSADAQDRLLVQAAYHVDRDRAARAAAHARRQLAQCDAALLG